ILEEEMRAAYKKLESRYGNHCGVAVRSSATAEDLPEASFAGQQESYLNIKGEAELLRVATHGFASLFTDRAISYRIDHGYNHMDVALSLGVQKMVRSDKGCAGVIFTLDTESGFKDSIFITGAYGLGEMVVQGKVNPDEFYVHKPTLAQGFKPLLKKRMGTKEIKLIYSDSAIKPTQVVKVDTAARNTWILSNEEIIELATQALTIENYYSTRHGSWMPMDIEWAKDGIDGKLYIVQARPETVHANNKHQTFIEEFRLNKTNNPTILCQGKSIGHRISHGKAVIIESASFMSLVQPGDIIVTDMTDPDWEPIMKKAGGIITNRGGRTCHAAIISRELGIPAIVGTLNATTKIKHGSTITLDCSTGEIGYVYQGAVSFTKEKIEITNLKKPTVDILMNVGNPDEAFNLAKLPNDGVGLARLEFIINNSIQAHPLALLHPERITDRTTIDKINTLTHGYADKKEYFIDKLAQEAGTIAAAFYPKPVIIRMSDFKSNEYRALLGGVDFEPEEENPMIGFRGASRYHHPAYAEAFALECAAMKKIRDAMGLTNIILMLPFVRTINEAKQVIATMEKNGLSRGVNHLELYMMCEIPSNVLLIEKFAPLFDGFSIGSNDLTQMTLAVDRDSALVAPLFDERNEAVKIMLQLAIEGACKAGKKIGICGQAPSDYPEIAEFLVKTGIHSLSLNPDTVVKMYQMLGQETKKLQTIVTPLVKTRNLKKI
ncbi:phosphoenolpyruvate synthase, partial [Candidatus Dependentiae bacterium]|nr:phosphoenolpyruvate synthase [Candidatus Dependentiae bacterium]